MLDRPIVILGAPRAGTSVLGHLLEAHPALVHAREPRIVWKYGNDGLSDMLPASAARPDVVAHIRKYFQQLVGDAPGERLLEKTPSNSLRVPFVDKVFPDARYIHITRNGFDSAVSIKSFWQNNTSGLGQAHKGPNGSILRQRLKQVKLRQVPFYAGEVLKRVMPGRGGAPRSLWGPRLPGLATMAREMSLIEVAGMQWRSCVERARIDTAAIAPDRYHELRLEDLDEAALKAALDFAGLDYADEVREFFRAEFQPEQTGSRRSALEAMDEAERHALRRVIAPTMAWLGYEEPAR